MGPKKKTELTISRYACGWECDGASDESKKKNDESSDRECDEECESGVRIITCPR